MDRCNRDVLPDTGRREFLMMSAAAAAAGTAWSTPVKAALETDKRQFMEEATRLAIESVEKGWGGPFGAVIVKDGEIIGRGQNRVLLTGARCSTPRSRRSSMPPRKLNPKALLGSDYGSGTIPRDDPACPRLARHVAGAGKDAHRDRDLRQRRPVPDVHERHLLVAHQPPVFRAPASRTRPRSASTTPSSTRTSSKPWADRRHRRHRELRARCRPQGLSGLGGQKGPPPLLSGLNRG